MPLYRASTGITLPIAESDVTSLTTDLAAKGAATTVATHDANFWAPSDHGFLAWTADPQYIGNSQILATAGVLYGVAVKLNVAATIASVQLRIVTAGSTMANTFVALYDSGGTRRAVTADQSATWNTNTGAFNPNFAASYAAAAGTYYVTILVGSAGTLPTISRGVKTNLLNDGLSAGSFRAWSSGTGQTAAPASVTLGSTAALDTGFWFALKA